jgi:hypothetical protein
MQLIQDDGFIELFNAVARVAKPMHPDFNLAKSLDDGFVDIEIDSLDCLLIVIYMCELFGVPEEIGKEFNPINIRELYNLIMEHKTKVPESIEAAIKEIE